MLDCVWLDLSLIVFFIFFFCLFELLLLLCSFQYTGDGQEDVEQQEDDTGVLSNVRYKNEDFALRF